MDILTAHRHCATVSPDIAFVGGVADHSLREIVEFAAAEFGNSRNSYFDWRVEPVGMGEVKVTLYKE